MNAIAYGSAQGLKFGTPDNEDFVVIEEQTEEHGFEGEVVLMGNRGKAIGKVDYDERTGVTIRGKAQIADITALPLGSILTQVDLQLGSGDVYLKTRRSTQTNDNLEDFELTAWAIDGITGAGVVIPDPV